MPERLPAWEEQEFINLGRIAASGSPEWSAEKSSWVGNPNFNYRPLSNGRWDFLEPLIGLKKEQRMLWGSKVILFQLVEEQVK